MKIKKITALVIMAALLCLAMSAAGCGKIAALNNMLTPEEAAAKLGTNYSITYRVAGDEGGYENVTFSQDGASYLIITAESCVIFDAEAKKSYLIDIAGKQYVETDLTDAEIEANEGVSIYSGLLYSYSILALFLNENGEAEVAGRDCIKYSYEDGESKGNYYVDKELGILMKYEDITGGTTTVEMEITDITVSGVSLSSFLQDFPGSYTKVGILQPEDPDFSGLNISVSNESGVAAGTHSVVYTVNDKSAYQALGITFEVLVKDNLNADIPINGSGEFAVEAGKSYTVTITAKYGGNTVKTASYTVIASLDGQQEEPDIEDLTITVSDESGIEAGAYQVEYTVNNKSAYITMGVIFEISVTDSSSGVVEVSSSGEFTAEAGEVYDVTVSARYNGGIIDSASYTVTVNESSEIAPDFLELTIITDNETDVEAGPHAVYYYVSDKQAYLDSGVTFAVSVKDEDENDIAVDSYGCFEVEEGKSYDVNITASKSGYSDRSSGYSVQAIPAAQPCPAFMSYLNYYSTMYFGEETSGLITNIMTSAALSEDAETEYSAHNAFGQISDEIILDLNILFQALTALKQYYDGTFEEGINKKITVLDKAFTINFLYSEGLYSYVYQVSGEYDEETDSVKLSAYYPETLVEPIDYCTLDFELQYIKDGAGYSSWLYFPDAIEEGEWQTYTEIKLLGYEEDGYIAETRQFDPESSVLQLYMGSANQGYLDENEDRVFAYYGELSFTDHLRCQEYLSYINQINLLEDISASVFAIYEEEYDENAGDANSSIDMIKSVLSEAETYLGWIKIIVEKRYRGLLDGVPQEYEYFNNAYYFEIGTEGDMYSYTIYYNNQYDYFDFLIEYNYVMQRRVTFASQSGGGYAISAIEVYEGEDEESNPIYLHNIYGFNYAGVEGTLGVTLDSEGWDSLPEGSDATNFPSGNTLYNISENSVSLMQ